MTCYKLLTCEFKVFGIQGKLEKWIHSVSLAVTPVDLVTILFWNLESGISILAARTLRVRKARHLLSTL